MSRGPDQLRLSPDERADLVAFVDGELPEATSRSLSTKLTQSATARREVEMLRKTWELLGHLPFPEVDPQFSERTITEIRRLELKNPAWESSVKTWSSWAVHAGIYLALAVLAVGPRPTGPLAGSGRTLRPGWPAICRWPSTWTNTWKWAPSSSSTSWWRPPSSIPRRIESLPEPDRPCAGVGRYAVELSSC